MTEQREIQYFGGQKVEGGLEGEFGFNPESTITVTLADDLVKEWSVAEPEETLKKIAPLFIKTRMKRGIVAKEYVLNAELMQAFKFESYEDAKEQLTQLAEEPSF